MKSFIIDGNSLINRAFYALPLLSNDRGEYLNAVYGFCNILVRIITDEKPDNIVVAFDYGKKTFRHEKFADYKGGRHKTPDELVMQFPLLKNVLDEMNITYFEEEGIEADDILGTLSKKLEGEVVILTGDKDALQLISPTTAVYFTKKGISQVDVVDKNTIKELFGLDSDQVVDYKALCGDSSDNLPGASGIGDKTAKMLLEKYGNVEGVYAHIGELSAKTQEKLQESRNMVMLCKELATIKTDCDIDLSKIKKYIFPFNKKIKDLFTEYQFKSILKRDELFEKDAESLQKKENKNYYEVEIEYAFDAEKLLNQHDKISSISLCVTENKFAFSINDETVCYSIKKENYLIVENAIKSLKKCIENRKIVKVCYDAKQLKHFLCGYDVCLTNYFDISIAEYLLCSTSKKHKNDDVATFFSEKCVLEEKMKNDECLELYTEIELPLVDVLFDMEKSGMKIDEKELRFEREQNSKELEKIENDIIELAGESFNINSSKQLAYILFDKLGIYSPDKKRSTASEFLQEIENDHPIVSLIMRQRKLKKIQSGYLDSYTDIINEKGNIVHTVFNQTLTATGRLSSSEPNLQNIPVRDEDGKFLRKLFISKFNGGYLTSADYSQIELRLLAHFSKDENLVEAFKNNQDIHTSTACKIFGKSESDISQNERRTAKIVNFGIIYGISDYGLSKNLSTTRKRAKEIIEKYFEVYHGIKTYLNQNIEDAKENGFCKTILNRRRYIPEIVSKNFALRTFGERVAMNMPLQGSASDIIKVAMLKVYKALNDAHLKSKLILQIHDELVVDTFPGEENKVKDILEKNMNDAIRLSVSLPVNISCGKNLMECK